MSGRLNRYLNQNATWSKKTGELNSYGEPVYEIQPAVECRVEKRIRQVTDSAGREIVSTMTLYVSPIDGVSGEDLVGDRLNGMTVQQVTEMRDSRGELVGYEVVL